MNFKAIMNLTDHKISEFCDEVLDAESLLEEFDEGTIDRKTFCEYLDIRESTLTGWLKENRIPKMAKQAYTLRKIIKVLKMEIDKMKNDLQVVKLGQSYQICKFEENEDGVLMGHVLIDGIQNEKMARFFSSSFSALQLLNEAKGVINDEISARGDFVPTKYLEDLKKRITDVTLFSTNYDEWRSVFGKPRFEDIEIDLDSLTSARNKQDNNDLAGKKHLIKIKTKEFEADNMTEILVWALRYLDNQYPDCLSILSKMPKRGSRPYISKKEEEVYPTAPHLLKECPPQEVGHGFYVGTNYGSEDVERILKAACKAVRIEYGKDLRLRFYQKTKNLSLDDILPDARSGAGTT